MIKCQLKTGVGHFFMLFLRKSSDDEFHTVRQVAQEICQLDLMNPKTDLHQTSFGKVTLW